MTGQPDLFDRYTRPCGAVSATACRNDTGMFCRCFLAEEHGGPHVCVNCNGQILPAPPSGPAAEPYVKEDGDAEAFDVFWESAEGAEFWVALCLAARTALDTGDLRFSTRTFLARYRDDNHVRVNNDFSPKFADLLIVDDPRLEAILERRKRTKAD